MIEDLQLQIVSLAIICQKKSEASIHCFASCWEPQMQLLANLVLGMCVMMTLNSWLWDEAA